MKVSPRHRRAVDLTDIHPGRAFARLLSWTRFFRVLVVLLSPFPAQASQVLRSFPTEDGGTVYAHLYGRGEHGVVLAHGGRFTKESWGVQALALEDAGFRTLAIDFRGRGRSTGPDSTGERGYVFDVLAAMRFLYASGAQSVSLVGASFGGWAAAEASVAADEGEIDRLVLLAHSPIEHPDLMKGRKLFILSRGDFSGDGLLRLPSIQRQFDRAPEPKELLVLDGDAHAQFLFDTDAGRDLMERIIRFLSEP